MSVRKMKMQIKICLNNLTNSLMKDTKGKTQLLMLVRITILVLFLEKLCFLVSSFAE